MKILLCRGGVSGVLWVWDCVSRFVVYVIAYAARMRAQQEGGGALIVLCAVVSCNAARVLLGITAVGVRVMCVRLCSLPPFCIVCGVLVLRCGRAVACGRVMTRVVVLGGWCDCGLGRD